MMCREVIEQGITFKFTLKPSLTVITVVGCTVMPIKNACVEILDLIFQSSCNSFKEATRLSLFYSPSCNMNIALRR